MNNSANLRPLAVLAVALCLILPALSTTPIRSKIYIVRNLKTIAEGDFLVGIEVGPDDSGKETVIGVFGVKPTIWDNIFKLSVPSNVVIAEVSLDKVPVAGLFEIVSYRPDLYSDLLPALLSNSSPKKVSEKLAVDLFKTLTPEAKAKISPEDLAELAKLYGQ